MPPRKAPDAGGLTPLEKRAHAAALAAPEHTLTGEDLALRLNDVPIEEQLLAINGLLKKSLFNAQKGPNGIQYVAVSKDEASLLGTMDANELIIYNHIKDAKNEGIWTKMIKARTNLHQTIMNRCLKLLEQKQLVKAVKSVKFPTRKIYMLYDLTPSIELSGGPWYTDNELDTGFIHELSMACLRFIQSKSWPKDGRSSALYPSSHTAELPTASSVHRYLKAAKLTDTELEPEHVVALLDLLIYDNEIEKIPVLPVQTARRGSRGAERQNDASDSEDSEASVVHSSAQRGSSRHRKHLRRGRRDSRSPDDSDESASHSDSSVAQEDTGRRKRQKHKEQAMEISSDDESAEELTANLTHVPYVYRAIKRMLPPHGGNTSSYVPLTSSWLQTPETVDQFGEMADSAELFFQTNAEASAQLPPQDGGVVVNAEEA
ncbi:34-kDa subunit of RNA polymerase III (C) [Malassezia brasiliensis]|uniref:34-kDa subunit of RNA polymerase III (C) n=1 Tax=Malassezia brasiliensis TaxID=1821822 RepID=A0AAF0DT48_9BASI|nr:34-kDa subunit of RNA polymerase III (C) [Malassezia brasiliensis]